MNKIYNYETFIREVREMIKTNKYKIRCNSSEMYQEIVYCLGIAEIPYTQKEEGKPVVCRAESDRKVQEALLGCPLSEENYTILKKVGEAWIDIPKDIYALKEEDEEKLQGLPDRAKRIYKDLQDGEKLSNSDLSYLVYNFELDDERDCGENRRWSRSVCSIVELGGKHYSITWEQGLTENQENEFWNQPVEVEKHQYPKTIVVTEWKPVGQEKQEEFSEIER